MKKPTRTKQAPSNETKQPSYRVRFPAALKETKRAQDRRRQDWFHLPREPRKPLDWDFAFELLPGDEPIAALFAKNNLNPDNPFDWRAVVDAFISVHAHKRKWTHMARINFALDLCSYRDTAIAWKVADAADAMRALNAWRDMNVEHTIDLVQEQHRIAAFDKDGYQGRLAAHYGEEFGEEMLRRKGIQSQPSEADDWPWN